MSAHRSSVRRAPEPQPSFAGIRRYARTSLDAEVVIQDADGWEVPVRAVDLSPVGMFVESDFLFDVGDEHVLIFRAPDGDFLFRLEARVVRVSEGTTSDEGGDEPGMAYEFVGPDSKAWAKLCSIVAES